MRTRYISQKYINDCGVACVAMIAGVKYEEAFAALGFVEDGGAFYTTRKQLTRALQYFGVAVERKLFRSWDEIPGRAIVAVNHRCNRRNFHWVVFTGKAVLDPNRKRKDSPSTRASGWYLLVVEGEITGNAK